MGRPGVQAITPESAIMMPESAITMAELAITMPGITDHDAGTGDHDGLETVITFDWIPRSRSPGLRTAAVHALALRQDPRLKTALEPLLADESQAVRLRAAAGYLRVIARQGRSSGNAGTR